MPRVSFGIPLISDLADQQHFPWQINENVIAFWSQRSSQAGKKVGNKAAIEQTARHYGECATLIYKEISVFKHALQSALIHLSQEPAKLQSFTEAVYRDRGSNQRLRFEAAIAVAAARAQKLQLVTPTPGQPLAFHQGGMYHAPLSRNSLLSTQDAGIQADLLGMAQSLVAAAHAAMTGFLHVSGWGESLCRGLSQDAYPTIFKAYHPDSMWLASVGLSWLPRSLRDEALVDRARELRALGYQSVASAYRQLVAYRRNPREQKRYLSLAKRFALKAQQYRAPGGVNAPFLRTFDVLENPDLFNSLPWKSQRLGITEALEIANAGIMARRFKEAETTLEAIAAKIPEWHLPVRSRAVRLQLACRLALGRPSRQLRDEAHEVCAFLPHDLHMLSLVEELKGDLRCIYPG